MKAKALIIGNANYPSGNLDNPIHDAEDIAEVLQRLGFEIEVHTNLNKVDQDKAITHFGTSLDDYNVGLFYFAGHGFQINNENYLASIDTNFEDEQHAKYSAFPLNMLLSYIDKAQNETTIIILDACREQLQKQSWYRSVESSGLAPILAPKGTLIAFATSPGQKAYDGTGNRNGVFTGALLQNMTVENIPIEEMFKRVRNSVFAFSKGRQTSWEHTSLTGTFYFNNGQLAHSTAMEYATFAIQDNQYSVNNTSEIDSIIKDLKSYNWYVQNPAVQRINTIDVHITDKNKLFLLGRNLLQAACGSAKYAIQFMDNLSNEIKKFQTQSKNHVLNGIAYEIFFNSYGSFRQDATKSLYLESVFNVLEMPGLEESLKFVVEILAPYKDVLFYIPSIDKNGISIDLEFSKSDGGAYFLQSIKYEGRDILVKKEEIVFWGVPNHEYYDPMIYNEMKYRLAYLMHIPVGKLNVNTNIHISDDTPVMYPVNQRIMK